MKTFLNIYFVVQSIAFIYWLYTMLFTKPTWNEGRNRFHSNWKEGGYIGLLMFVFIAIAISISLAKIYLWFNFLIF